MARKRMDKTDSIHTGRREEVRRDYRLRRSPAHQQSRNPAVRNRYSGHRSEALGPNNQGRYPEPSSRDCCSVRCNSGRIVRWYWVHRPGCMVLSRYSGRNSRGLAARIDFERLPETLQPHTVHRRVFQPLLDV